MDAAHDHDMPHQQPQQFTFYPPEQQMTPEQHHQQPQPHPQQYMSYQPYMVSAPPVPVVPSQGMHPSRMSLLVQQSLYTAPSHDLHTPPPIDDETTYAFERAHANNLQQQQHHTRHTTLDSPLAFDPHHPPPLDGSEDSAFHTSRDSSGPASPASARGLSLALGGNPIRYNPIGTAPSPANSSSSSRGSHRRRRSSPGVGEDAYSDDDGNPMYARLSGMGAYDNMSAKELTRRQRIEAEQRRRDELRDGYARLKAVLPTNNQKASKVALLDRATNHIVYLESTNKSMQTRLRALEEDMKHLRNVNELISMRLSSSNGGTAGNSNAASPHGSDPDSSGLGSVMHGDMAHMNLEDSQGGLTPQDINSMTPHTPPHRSPSQHGDAY